MATLPSWPWCAQLGASRAVELAVDQTNYGDGYIHRSTRGLNPVRPSWTLNFPFTSQPELQRYDDFLNENAARGFWFTPPDMTSQVFVYADQWSYTITDKTGTGIVGTLQATFVRIFNPQPGGGP